jgi:phosphatidylserine/phosphatidylglycerophosphate/cardiolipin synthase-like enzyme
VKCRFSGVLRVVHNEMRNEALTAIARSSIGQVFAYCLEQPSTKSPIYVHSKLTVIDDCYVGIGSVNLNKRSQTTDSELHLSVVDGDVMPGAISGAPVSVCRFAKELRIALWGEHLGITDPAKLGAVLAADVVKQASTFLGRL